MRVDVSRSTIISVNKVKDLLVSDLKGDADRLVLDWCWLTLFCGTDYTPRLAGFDYRKVYSLWRAFKKMESNQHLYLIRIIETSNGDGTGSTRTTKYELHPSVFESVLRASNCPSMQSHHLRIPSGHKVRDLHISISDWKCNWNALKQAFCKGVQFQHEVTQSKAHANPARHRIYWIDPNTGEKRLAGEGRGINTRTAEYFSTLQACMPTSSIMDLHIRNTMSAEDFDKLSNVLQSVASHSTLMDTNLAPRLEAASTLPYSSSDPKRYDSLTKESRAIKDDPAACKELIKGTFWTLSMLQAEIPNGNYFYPYNLPPSVTAMQHFLEGLIQASIPLTFSIGTPSDGDTDQTTSADCSSSLSIPWSHYSFDALPPIQFFVSVASKSKEALQTLNAQSARVLREVDVDPVIKGVRRTMQPQQGQIHHTVLKYTLTNNSARFAKEAEEKSKRIFQGHPLNAELDPPSASQSSTAALGIQGSESGTLQTPLMSLLEQMEPAFLRSSPSLMFLNPGPHPALFTEDGDQRPCASQQYRHKPYIREEETLDWTELYSRTKPLIRSYNGTYHRKLVCYEETPAVSNSKTAFRPFRQLGRRRDELSGTRRSFATRSYTESLSSTSTKDWKARRTILRSVLRHLVLK